MPIFLAMTIAGTIPLLGYFVVEKIEGSSLEPKYYSWILKASLLFFLCPFQLFKYFLPEWMIYGRMNLGLNEPFPEEFLAYISVPAGDGEYYLIPLFILEISICVAVVILLLFAYRFFVCRKETKRLVGDSVVTGCKEESGSLFKHPFRWKKSKKKQILLYENDKITSPFTFGWRNPAIVMPKKTFTDEEKEWILRHEMIHIRRRDVFWKYLCVAACIVHWYNPFVYVLMHEFCQVCESCCDRECLCGMEIDKKKEYAVLIVKIAAEPAISFTPVSAFSIGTKKRIKKRIDSMFEKKKAGIARKISVILMGLSLLSCTTVFAYEKPSTMDRPLNGVEEISFSEEEIEIDDFSQSDEIFIDEDGNVTPIDKDAEAELRAACKHTYVAGTYKTHVKSTTSKKCEVRTYQCKRCKKCGKKLDVKRISTLTYDECPHGN
ncbi:MAG: M56 family metallopeptidase [Lachnospiraceae bacterium]|nr:M56 family metallopeptidase [Lachnospiraceae bacterium]